MRHKPLHQDDLGGTDVAMRGRALYCDRGEFLMRLSQHAGNEIAKTDPRQEFGIKRVVCNSRLVEKILVVPGDLAGALAKAVWNARVEREIVIGIGEFVLRRYAKGVEFEMAVRDLVEHFERRSDSAAQIRCSAKRPRPILRVEAGRVDGLDRGQEVVVLRHGARRPHAGVRRRDGPRPS